MTYTVTIETVAPRIMAAARRRVKGVEVPTAFRAPLDAVWAYLRSHPGLRTDGHNIFLYHHTSGHPATGLDVDFGVEVTRHFPAEGDIACVETPGGRAAVVVHRGPYTGISAAHGALHRWCHANGHDIGAHSWEIYGDWDDDESKLETTIVYALPELRAEKMQDAVLELARLGPLPSSASAEIPFLQRWERLLMTVRTPVSNDDARTLVGLFGPDDCFGLAWTLLHLIETAPEWPLEDCLSGTGNEWIERLKSRAGR